MGRQLVLEDVGGKTWLLVGSSNSIPGLFLLSPGTCTIRNLPKVETCGLSPKDVPRLTETVRQVTADALAELSADRCVDQGAEQPPFLRCAGARAGRGQGSPQCKEDTSRASN